LLLNIIIFLDYVKSKKNIICPLTKTLSKELVYNSLRKIGYLVDSRSQDLDLNKKTKLYNILSSTWKLLFLAYSYDKKSVSWNVINDELYS
jgi:hypothetical protein